MIINEFWSKVRLRLVFEWLVKFENLTPSGIWTHDPRILHTMLSQLSYPGHDETPIPSGSGTSSSIAREVSRPDWDSDPPLITLGLKSISHVVIARADQSRKDT